MSKELKKALPLGSVVLLKGAKRYLVVMGYLMVEEGTDKVWDYMGCAYPVGAISSEATLMFDEEQIDKVIFEGFTDEEGETFRAKVAYSIGDEK
ncbi:MAG: DUF4176 domain-containing protein [bacterium]|nr:DUF4176 domain-containing protein [bacterium]